MAATKTPLGLPLLALRDEEAAPGLFAPVPHLALPAGESARGQPSSYRQWQRRVEEEQAARRARQERALGAEALAAMAGARVDLRLLDAILFGSKRARLPAGSTRFDHLCTPRGRERCIAWFNARVARRGRSSALGRSRRRGRRRSNDAGRATRGPAAARREGVSPGGAGAADGGVLARRLPRGPQPRLPRAPAEEKSAEDGSAGSDGGGAVTDEGGDDVGGGGGGGGGGRGGGDTGREGDGDEKAGAAGGGGPAERANFLGSLECERVLKRLLRGAEPHERADLLDMLDITGEGGIYFGPFYVLLALVASSECHQGAKFLERFGESVFAMLVAASGHTVAEPGCVSAESVGTLLRLYGVMDEHATITMEDAMVGAGTPVSYELFLGVAGPALGECDRYKLGVEARHVPAPQPSKCGPCCVIL